MSTMFETVIKTVLDNWTALQFAIEQQAGGKDTDRIAEWMIGAVKDVFMQNEELEEEEVADYLSDIMDQEMNTLVDDESDLQVGRCLCRLYRMCESGQESAVIEELSKMPKCDLSTVKLMDQEESETTCPHSAADQMNGLQLSEEMATESPPRELTELEKQQLEDEANGWTVKRKGNKKR